ncbi:homocysteine S-methyltransferase [Lactobacillus kalixensis]|uniref:Homocysteine S-methyltransferase n=1 Tax=Lactobacillus kalixensis DSM 16043 TaxID=1423763 RepID=A0A0R1UBL4_9LACO|nr:homocysteine S-methyltransferase [Lactobacillus kalixensis]KRL90590.1 Homocysteine S-methyltransferase [Lactobacillus kalixensis DSM 16043]
MGLLEKVKNGIVLDGAMSDELEKQGVKTNNPLWTGIALVNQLDAVYQAHTDYFNAGAELVITNTYQANVQAFEKLGYSRKEAEEFIKNAVKIAKKARDDYETKTGKHNYVAATIGSYGAYLADGSEYSGDFELTKKAYLDFHLPRLQLVLEEEPDLIALETQPKISEPVAVLDWLQENHPDIPVYVSFTLKDATHLSDGTTIKEAVQELKKYDQVISVGINCIKPDLVNDSLSEFHRFTNLPLVVYPNLGATYDPKIKQWVEFKEKFDFEELTNEWFNHGARLIGGCCTTGPKEISEIHEAIEKLR